MWRISPCSRYPSKVQADLCLLANAVASASICLTYWALSFFLLCSWSPVWYWCVVESESGIAVLILPVSLKSAHYFLSSPSLRFTHSDFHGSFYIGEWGVIKSWILETHKYWLCHFIGCMTLDKLIFLRGGVRNFVVILQVRCLVYSALQMLSVVMVLLNISWKTIVILRLDIFLQRRVLQKPINAVSLSFDPFSYFAPISAFSGLHIPLS